MCVLGSSKESGSLVYHDRSNGEDDNAVVVSNSSKKILDMGFFYNYGVEDIIVKTIKWSQAFDILNEIPSNSFVGI